MNPSPPFCTHDIWWAPGFAGLTRQTLIKPLINQGGSNMKYERVIAPLSCYTPPPPVVNMSLNKPLFGASFFRSANWVTGKGVSISILQLQPNCNPPPDLWPLRQGTTLGRVGYGPDLSEHYDFCAACLDIDLLKTIDLGRDSRFKFLMENI